MFFLVFDLRLFFPCYFICFKAVGLRFHRFFGVFDLRFLHAFSAGRKYIFYVVIGLQFLSSFTGRLKETETELIWSKIG